MEKYYNGSNILNNGCTMNFLVGNRSTGKSFYWKRYCVRQYLNKGRRFLYLRRRDADLKTFMSTWFDDISIKFPGWSFMCKANKMILYKMDADTGDIIEKEVIGYAYSMSESSRLKSIPLETIDTIFFDEFLPDNGQYIKPSIPMYEPEQLESIYMTIARGYNKVIRPEVKVICVSNATTRYSPYFAYYDIDLTSAEKWKSGGVYAELYFNEVVAEEIMNSFEFGKTLAQGSYGRHALLNEFLRDTDTHVQKHPKNAKPLIQLYFKRWFIFWGDYQNNLMYVSEGYDKNFKRKYYIAEHPFEESIPMLSGDVLKMVQHYLRDDRVYYDNLRVKSIIFSALQPLLGRRV